MGHGKNKNTEISGGKAWDSKLIVKAISFEEFSRLWVPTTNSPMAMYHSNTGTIPQLNLQLDKLYIRKGLGVKSIVFITTDVLSSLNLRVETSVKYNVAYYDDLLEVLIKDHDSVEINISE